MDDIRGLVTGGWHPDGKRRGKERWQGELKGLKQVSLLLQKLSYLVKVVDSVVLGFHSQVLT